MKQTPQLVYFCRVALFLGTLLIGACGGGGSGNPSPAGGSAPSGLSYPTPQVFTLGQAITALTPTVTGTVSSYTVSPALPAGLTISATTGAISGTPTALSSKAKYTMTAGNSAGTTQADIELTVNDSKPTLSYGASAVALAQNLKMTDLIPVIAGGGGPIITWSISSDLPAGLFFNTSNGRISGTPTAESAAAPYTVTAINSSGQATFVLTLSVQSGVVLDLGHADAISALRFDGTRVISRDTTGHWVLWNYATGASIATGDTPCSVSCQSDQALGGLGDADLAGQTIAIETATGFELRSAADGHVTATIVASAPVVWWKLATDGSYLVAGSAGGGVQIWSATGTAVVSKAQGGYLSDAVFAAPGEVRAAIPLGGQNVVETISLATGVSTYSPSFNGMFRTWFADGSRFLTQVATISGGVVVSNDVYTYSKAAVQQDVITIQSVGGLQATGNWFGNFFSGSVYLYQVGAGNSPAATYALAGPATISGTSLVALSTGTSGVSALTFIDLSGAVPVRTDRPVPPDAALSNYAIFSALSPTLWVSGNFDGVLFDGASALATPRYFDYGAVWGIAGSDTRFAVSTASGRVLHFDAATKALEGTIRDFSSKVLLSKDGTVLAALGGFTHYTDSSVSLETRTTRVYSLPGDGLVSTWPANNTDLPPADIDLSASGTMLGQVFARGTAAVYPIAGGAATWSGTCTSLQLSPEGSHIICSQKSLFNNGDNDPVASLSGISLGWLDNGHLLVNKYHEDHLANMIYDGNGIYDPAGNQIGSAALPELQLIQALTPDTLFAPQLNTIFSVSSSSGIWTSPDPSRGPAAVAGSNVIFASGRQVLALPR